MPLIAVELRQLGGAVAREPRVPNAAPGRHGAFTVLAIGPAVPGILPGVRAAGRAVLAALAPWAAPGAR